MICVLVTQDYIDVFLVNLIRGDILLVGWCTFAKVLVLVRIILRLEFFIFGHCRYVILAASGGDSAGGSARYQLWYLLTIMKRI